MAHSQIVLTFADLCCLIADLSLAGIPDANLSVAKGLIADLSVAVLHIADETE